MDRLSEDMIDGIAAFTNGMQAIKGYKQHIEELEDKIITLEARNRDKDKQIKTLEARKQ